jgi:hypothetical protein
MKAVSTWNTLQFTQPEVNQAGSLITLAAVILIAGAVVAWAMRRFSAA